MFRIGLILFILTLGYGALRQSIAMLQARAETNALKMMAYTDALTRIPNRAAFEQKMEELDAQWKPGVVIGLLIFDLNNLKETNDRLGHAAGDSLIRGAAQCIQSAFAGKGKCYRIGGDEFAAGSRF